MSKAFVIKNKEGKYRIPETFDDYEMALCCCPSDCEVVEITIAEGDLEQENKELKEQLTEQIDYKEEYYHYWQETKKELAQFTDYIERLGFNNFNDFEEWMGTFLLTPHEEQTLIKELKEQLAIRDRMIMLILKNTYYIDKEYFIEEIPTQDEYIISQKKYWLKQAKESMNDVL